MCALELEAAFFVLLSRTQCRLFSRCRLVLRFAFVAAAIAVWYCMDMGWKQICRGGNPSHSRCRLVFRFVFVAAGIVVWYGYGMEAHLSGWKPKPLTDVGVR